MVAQELRSGNGFGKGTGDALQLLLWPLGGFFAFAVFNRRFASRAVFYRRFAAGQPMAAVPHVPLSASFTHAAISLIILYISW
jgi:hypothetical protein